LLCKRDGWKCKGLEISSQLIEFAREFGRAHNLEPDIELGNIEEADIGNCCYDVIIANSVFEHIEKWQIALDRVYRALKPGGMFFFTSTNKFSFISYEYSEYPLYSWLPNRQRYRLRMARQGADIMKLGIDFNEFTYPELRRAFRKAGFSKIYDRLQAVDVDQFRSWKGAVVRLIRATPLLKEPILTFCDATLFVCIK
jgi:SAM-dependent methyltransferase